METMTPEVLLEKLDEWWRCGTTADNREWYALAARCVRALIANQREQPEPVPYVDWPSAESVRNGQSVWTAEYQGERQTVIATTNEIGVFVKADDGSSMGIVFNRLDGDGPSKFLPCTVTPHPALEPERVEPRPLMLYGQPKHPDQATWLARFGDHWRSIGCARAYRSIDIIEVNEAATDCPEAVALWRSEGGGQ